MRDATDYYNLLSDTLKNGSSHIKYLYNKIDNAKLEGKYVNIRTGYLIQEKDFNDKNFFFNYDQDFPLCYNFSCCGLARKRVIKKMMDFYLSCLKEFDNSKDEELMKEKIRNELESAKNDYEYLNKNNNGFDDLKLFKTIPHKTEEKDDEPSINTSSFINDENSEESNDSFIDDESISEKKEKKKKFKLIKNGKKVINEYKEELDDLLDNNNYDGEDELNQEEKEINNEEDEENNEISDNEDENGFKNIKRKKLHKTKLLNKKTKRNIINDSDDEDENELNKEKEKIKEEDIQNLLNKYNNEENQKTNEKNELNKEDEEYFNNLKENLNLKQRTLDDFLNPFF